MQVNQTYIALRIVKCFILTLLVIISLMRIQSVTGFRSSEIHATSSTVPQVVRPISIIPSTLHTYPDATTIKSIRKCSRSSLHNIQELRGGATVSTSDTEESATIKSKQKKRKKSSKKRTKNSSKSTTLTRKSSQNNKTTASHNSDEEGKSEETMTRDTINGRRMINTAMKESDFATAMGDAIRRESPEFVLKTSQGFQPSQRIHHHPYYHLIDTSLTSIGSGIGSSDVEKLFSSKKKDGHEKTHYNQNRRRIHEDAGGVEASPSAVLVNYFLKSHGGVHGLQSACSLLSTLFGIAALLAPMPQSAGDSSGTIITGNYVKPSPLPKMIWLHRCIICALTKHLSGFLAATWVCAYRFSQVGWIDTRKRMEALATDVVAQYLFYCSTLILWTGSADAKIGKTISEAGIGLGSSLSRSSQNTTPLLLPWWLDGSPIKRFIITLSLLGPVLLREFISTLWVLADVLVLLQSAQRPTSSSDDGNNVEESSQILSTLFYTGRTTIHTFMNILLKVSSPSSEKKTEWKDMDAITRQRILAKLTSQLSLSMELVTGCIVLYDAIRAFWEYSILPVGSSGRPSIRSVGMRLICARLFINFLLVRKRQKLKDLFVAVRGGSKNI